MSESAQKIKNHAFPIETQLEIHGVIQKVLVHKLVLQGAMIELFSPDLKTQETLNFKLFLPTEGVQIDESVVVVKTYNKFKEVKKDGKVHVLKDQIQYLAEVHFKRPKIQTQNAIENFLKRFEKKVIKSE